MDPAGREVRKRGKPVPVTPTEFDLLHFLALHPGVVFSRDRLMDRLRGADFFGDLRAVDVHVRHLREKLEDDPSNPRLILTVRGHGYKLAARGGESGT